MNDRIVVLDGYTTNPGDLDWSPLGALGELEVFDRTPAARVAERVGAAPYVLLNKTLLTGETLRALPGLRYVGVLATGYNTVDLASAKVIGVTVTNTPAYASVSVAQHAAAMMLDLARGLTRHANAVRGGAWSRSPDWCLPLTSIFELTDRTLGLVGLGAIGIELARIAAALGMRVIACDPAFPPPARLGGVAVTPVSLETLIETADVVSLHCPLSPATHHLIDAPRLARMKRSALILNTSRGPLIDEAALAAALHGGVIAGAALDVLEVEPP
ncbi:MAG TPA: NAD(P)-dependent oxidoreductase, partial [Caulobacteraceae bacterium]|nr:NAD(P)-dependent oxidoreductase [Caulobacteraceae bacterium]